MSSNRGVSLFSLLLVTVQFFCVGGIAAMGSLQLAGIPLLIALGGIGLGGWAVWVMRRARFRVVPDVHAEATMVQEGPYRYIRHPMYTALLLIMAAFVCFDFSVGRAMLWVGLFFDLVVKLLYEESLLRRFFPNYAEYCRTTWRFLPFVI